jgi:hypothetical protein
VLQLTSDTASSSALPDGFGFNVSRKGTFIAMYTAANVWLVKAGQLPRLWARTLEVKRKPVAVDIQENGFLLAVLSRPSQVDLYEIHGERDRQIKKRRTVMLVHEAHAMVMSPDARILIVGNQFGIELVSIGPDAPETSRRTLSGPVGDTLEFSDDGRTLLITSYARKSAGSSMFVLPGLYDGPLDEEGVPVPLSPEAVWTGTVLFPETTRIARQATLIPDAAAGHVNELFAFNSDEDTWGIYDIGSQRFTQRKMFLPDQQRWTRSEFLDEAMPAVSPNADLAAVSLCMRGTTSIWIYQVPEWDLEPKPMPDHDPIQPCFCVPIAQEDPDANHEICVLRWVTINPHVQRLIAVGNTSTAPTEPHGPAGSRAVIIVLDFDKRRPPDSPTQVSTKTEYDLDPLLPGEKLPEGSIDFDREVELVRTRTIAQRRAQDRTDGRRSSRTGLDRHSTTTRSRERPPPVRPVVPTITREESDELTMEEAQAAFEAPYDNTQPRSQNSLARAATVAAVSPANRRHLRALPFRPLEYRRADGMREFPHESDADNWVPPPPVYTATAEASQSVSLSHPNGAPLPVGLDTAPGDPISQPPALSASINPSQRVAENFYQQRQPSFSSSNLALVLPERPPSLLHPSTYPSPLAAPSGRRRSSTAAQSPPTQLPPPIPVLPQNQSAYQATASSFSARRPTLRGRRAIESTINLRPPPVIDPNATGRRGSAPDTRMTRQLAPLAAHPNRISMPLGGRNMLSVQAPLTSAQRRMEPLPALPSTNVDTSMQAHGRPETRLTMREKRRLNCVVM